MLQDTLLAVDDLCVSFPTPRGDVRAVSGVSFRVKRGQTFGIVGESGCGKTATGRAILRLVPRPGKIVGGQILFNGEDLLERSESEIRQLRGRRIAMVFQDPAASLNPLFTIGQQLFGIMKRHRIVSAGKLKQRAIQLLDDLGLPSPEDFLQSYPHQLSGGMQQRAMIAMALCAEPDLIIADEPTSALDVTIQSQILDLLVRLKGERGITLLLITHDLGVVARTCDQVAVFYLGKIVEMGSVRNIFRDTRHPYTRGLMAALPNLGAWRSALNVIPGSVPTHPEALSCCPFASRCQYGLEICRTLAPPLIPIAEAHDVACHLFSNSWGDSARELQ